MSVEAVPGFQMRVSRRRADRNFLVSRAFQAMSAPVNPEQDADVQLMLAVRQGDTEAFRHLFEKHLAGVVRFATQFVGSRARAEELAQDVFLHLYRTRERYVPRARFKTWLYRMVTNSCLSEVRRPDHRARQHFTGDAGDGYRPAPPEPADRSSEEVFFSQEAVDRMRAALATLPQMQRAAVLLARGEGFSYEDVAQSLSCSVSAVKSLVHRATLTLRERLKDEA